MRRIFFLIFISTFLVLNTTSADKIKLKGSSKIIEGKVIKVTERDIVVKEKGGGTVRFPKSWVEDIIRSAIPENELYTKQDLYFEKLKEIQTDDAKGNLELGLWCFKNRSEDEGFMDLAWKHLKQAKELNPDYAKLVDPKLKIIEERKAKDFYKSIEDKFNQGQYLIAEREILSLIRSYPNSNYVAKAKDILVEIWGEEEAAKLLTQERNLPPVAVSKREFSIMMRSLKDEDMKRAYVSKCLDRGQRYETKIGEVEDINKKQGYIISALGCYELLKDSENSDIRSYVHSKIIKLTKRLFRDCPILPSNTQKKDLIKHYLNNIKEDIIIEEICDYYFNRGRFFQNQLKELKDANKREKAILVYNCYSLVYDFSKEDYKRQNSYQRLKEVQGLIR